MSFNLSVAAIFRNEAPYLREWLEFHKLVGVQHFYLYNNDSSDAPGDVLGEYLIDGTVDLMAWPGPVAQRSAYESALSQHRGETDWLAFIDLDEYLFSPTGAPLPVVLESYADHPGVVANWCVFGPGPHEVQPPGPVIGEYCERTPDDDPINLHVKSIVRPGEAIAYSDPHSFLYAQGVACDERHWPVVGPLTRTHSADVLRVNHYFTKSVEEAREKFQRGRADTGTTRDWSEFEALRAACTEEDTLVWDLYGERLVKAMA